jgi:fumarylacetoacetase
MSTLDATHDPARRSWVTPANGHPHFPIQNLPLGMVSHTGPARPAMAIGDQVLDLGGLASEGWLEETGSEIVQAIERCHAGLKPLLALGARGRQALRRRAGALLDASVNPAMAAELQRFVHPARECTLHLPASVGDYTDFYAGINHARNVGGLFRPDDPLFPNYRHLPVGYHGRASSVVPDGSAIRRPHGQILARGETSPRFGPSGRLDHELELAIWIGPGNTLGAPVPIAEAAAHIAGYGLLNDWSARDIQLWEYQPLGPFLAKSFSTTVSPWIISPEALAPFQVPVSRDEADPPLLPYLVDPEQAVGLGVTLEVFIQSEAMRAANIAPHRLSLGNASALYWTPAQMLAHHTCGGCNLRSGDLFGSGTISGTEPGSFGSLLEITEGGKRPVRLPSGEERRFLEDGDDIILRGTCMREGFASIGFGECRGRVTAS